MPNPVRNLATLLPVIVGIFMFQDLWAGMENCRFALHWKQKFSPSKTITSLCDNPATTTVEPNYSPNFGPTPLPCTSYTTTAPLSAGTVYVVIGGAGYEGVLAASFGIDYDGTAGVGIDPQYVTWTPCADGFQFPSSDGVHGEFPRPGGGLRITWNNSSCQRQEISGEGIHAVIGSLYVYAYSRDELRATTNNNILDGPELVVGDCGGGSTDLVKVWGLSQARQYCCSTIGFGDITGWNACASLIMPSLPTTWGKMKHKYPRTNSLVP